MPDSIPVATESQEQAALVQWAGLAASRYPALSWLFAIPNGGVRHPAVAAQLRAEGVKAGVPDLMLPARSGCYAGAFVEMKRVRGGREAAVQRAWRDYLVGAGYACVVARGWLEARDFLAWYVQGAQGKPPI